MRRLSELPGVATACGPVVEYLKSLLPQWTFFGQARVTTSVMSTGCPRPPLHVPLSRTSAVSSTWRYSNAVG